jgi:ArsR family metal-binding transcriptional regulator
MSKRRKNKGGYGVLARISRNKMFLNRIIKLRKAIQINTQKLRGKALQSLEELFNMAKDQAKNEVLTIKQRQMWTRIAAYICQVINSVASGFDERQIDVQLDELESLINEAKSKAKVKRPKTKTAKRKKDKAA